jgi:hypothetical protein
VLILLVCFCSFDRLFIQRTSRSFSMVHQLRTEAVGKEL